MTDDWIHGNIDGLKTVLDLIEDGRDIEYIRNAVKDGIKDMYDRLYLWDGRE